MVYSTQHTFFQRNVILSSSFLIAILIQIPFVSAATVTVPIGFQIKANGSIVVKDPSMAVAPAGYHISRWGELVKNRESLIKPLVEAKPEPAMPDPAKKIKNVVVSEQQITIPPGFHRMGNGDIMANNPANAIVPPGFRMTPDGVLKLKTDLSPDPEPVVASETTMEFKEIPAGFHRMPNGTLMANNPSKAVAPEGYHLMPDGTIMATGSQIDHSKHSHKGGGMWMAESKQVRMYMNGMLDTTNKVNPTEVTNSYGYSMAPTNMTMDMNMLMLMYHSRKYMVMSMLHYMSNDMGMITPSGVSGAGSTTASTMASNGLGDTVVTVTVPGFKKFDYTLGISLPTGSIDEEGPMLEGLGDVHYPYGMQLGSGTYDMIAGVSYEGSKAKMQWGVGYEYKLRTGSNANNYTLGDRMNIESWIRKNFSSTVNAEAKLHFLEVGRISGADSKILNPDMSPVADSKNYGGRRADVALGIKYENAKMFSVGADFSLPIYQNLFGPQMKSEWEMGLEVGFMF